MGSSELAPSRRLRHEEGDVSIEMSSSSVPSPSHHRITRDKPRIVAPAVSDVTRSAQAPTDAAMVSSLSPSSCTSN